MQIYQNIEICSRCSYVFFLSQNTHFNTNNLMRKSTCNPLSLKTFGQSVNNQSSSHCYKTVLMLMKVTQHASCKMDAVRNGNVIYTNLLFGFGWPVISLCIYMSNFMDVYFQQSDRHDITELLFQSGVRHHNPNPSVLQQYFRNTNNFWRSVLLVKDKGLPIENH